MIGTRPVQIEVEEAGWKYRASRTISRVMDDAGLIRTASDMMGHEGGWMAQRATHAVTQNELR